jgi:ribonuclease T2
MTRQPLLRAAYVLGLLAALAFALPRAAGAGGKPGEFAYYVLTLSWSPTYCEDEGRGKQQCTSPRPYAFVLHGLWPQYARGWPQDCDIGRKPWVPREVIDAMLDIMPARGLIIHEYRKHGTCSGLSAADYYALARALFEQIKIPARYLGPRQPVTVSPSQIVSDFVKTNLALSPEMLAVSCGSRNRLREVRICFSRQRKPIPCGDNERQDRLCRLERIVMPPVRGTTKRP